MDIQTEQIIEKILKSEGGFVDHKDDSGGPTKYGITIATLSKWRGKEVTVDDLKSMHIDEARMIYRFEYVERPRFAYINDVRLRHLVIDSAVQHGQKVAARWLQSAVGVEQDGIVGPVTLDAVNSRCVHCTYRLVLAQRYEYYGETISENRSNSTFALGWMRRMTPFLMEAP